MKASLFAIAAIIAATSVSAEVRPYIGTGDLFNPFNNARIGFDLGNNVRLEGNVGYDQEKTGDFKKTETKIGLTGFYDIKTNSNVTPFVGLSVSRESTKEDWIGGTDTTTTGFGAQVGAAFELVKGFNLDAALKFDSEKEKNASDRTTGLGLGLGARYSF